MTRHKHFSLPALGIIVLLVVPAPARADAGDKIVRGGLAFVSPSQDLEWGGTAQMDFMDPRFPPSGRFDSLEEFTTSAQSNFGFGIGFEYGLTDLIGIDTNFNYSSHDSYTIFSGEITYTPATGDPPALDPDRSEYAPIIGTGAGRDSLLVFTAGANFHVLRRKAVDLYFGPVIGLAFVRSDLTSGGFTASFPSFMSATPVESVDWSQSTHYSLVGGAVFGVDVTFGNEGWLLSIATKYLQGGVNPWAAQVGLGYRF